MSQEMLSRGESYIPDFRILSDLRRLMARANKLDRKATFYRQEEVR